MTFQAKIVRRSAVYIKWTSENRAVGLFNSVRFKREGPDYVAEEKPLSPESVAALQDNSMVQLSVITEPVPFPAAPPKPLDKVDDKKPEPKPAEPATPAVEPAKPVQPAPKK